jgi:hypothetical protein
MEGIGRTTGTWAVVGVAVLAMLVLPGLVSTASASPVPLGSSASQQWAYGAQKWVNASFTTNNGTYTSQAYFGWQVIFTATNTSATTVMLEAQRTMAGSFYAKFCSPTCTNATAQGSLSITGHDSDTGFANLTTAATVDESGTPVPAVGLLNTHSQANGNISEALQYSYLFGGKTWAASQSLYVTGSAHALVNFSSALGLIPYNVTAGQSWNSSAAFSAAGAWALNATWARVGVLGSKFSGSPSAASNLSASGTVSLWGSDIGTITLANGQTVPVIVLAWTGPFDDLDGIILVPHAYDMFGDAAQPYSSDQLGAQTVTTANLDLYVDSAHHVHFVASAASYLAADDTLATQSTAAASTTPAATASPTVVQAQPESVATAEQSANCLSGGCSGGAGASASSGVLGVALLVGLAVVVVVGAVSVIEYSVWARRRAQMGGNAMRGPIRAANPPPGAAFGVPPPTAPPPMGGPRSPPRPPV